MHAVKLGIKMIIHNIIYFDYTSQLAFAVTGYLISLMGRPVVC